MSKEQTAPEHFILLLDGKLWKVELPEKPNPEDYGYNPNMNWTAWYCDKRSTSKSKYYINACKKYDRAYSLALEQKIEIINPSEIGPFLLQDNEPIKWEGTFVRFTVGNCGQFGNIQCQGNHAECHKNMKCQREKDVVRLIAPVKEENSAMSYTEGSDYTLSRESDEPGIQLNTNISTSPVPSEQEKQEPKDIDFLMWYSGNSQDEITSAYKRYLKGNQS